MDHHTLVTASQAYTQTFNNSAAVGLADCFTAEGQLVPPIGRPIFGPHAIQAFWQGVFDTGIRFMSLDAEEVEMQGCLAYEMGRYVLSDKTRHVRGEGRYLVIWHWIGGAWKRHREMFSSS